MKLKSNLTDFSQEQFIIQNSAPYHVDLIKIYKSNIKYFWTLGIFNELQSK
jgi:hypothetical protein